jgi:hypothetical protein
MQVKATEEILIIGTWVSRRTADRHKNTVTPRHRTMQEKEIEEISMVGTRGVSMIAGRRKMIASFAAIGAEEMRT